MHVYITPSSVGSTMIIWQEQIKQHILLSLWRIEAFPGYDGPDTRSSGKRP
jgi:hypothetical protein